MLKTISAVVGILFLVPLTYADDACDAWNWDVRTERALFSGIADPLIAGTDESAMPSLQLAHEYALALTDQSRVHFRVQPGKKASTEGAHAGLAQIHISRAGLYRISIDVRTWVDVVAGNQLLESHAFQGTAGCSSPHKIVEYELPTGDLTLQFSNAAHERIRIAVTESPSPSP